MAAPLNMESEMKIYNLTQHRGTPEQLAAGLVEQSDADRPKIASLLTFRKPPTREEITSRAQILAGLVPAGCGAVMIGGAPFLMSALETAIRNTGRFPWYSFSERVSVETTDPATGVVSKSSEFRHLGWVSVPCPMCGTVPSVEG